MTGRRIRRLFFCILFCSLFCLPGTARAAEGRESGSARISLFIEGKRTETFPGRTEGLLLCAESFRELAGMAVLDYPDGRILVQSGTAQVLMRRESSTAYTALEPIWLQNAPFEDMGRLWLPAELLWKVLGCRLELAEPPRHGINIRLPDREERLPASYDGRKYGRTAAVQDQGDQGSCWAFAALTALEMLDRPGKTPLYSAEHMIRHNSFGLQDREGGDYTMAEAYLLAWQGPVTETEDPYGDGESPEGLAAAAHVQEVRHLQDAGREEIRQAVFCYGGVLTSLYMPPDGSRDNMPGYRKDRSSYCYRGQEMSNHDVVIIGWDDRYPREAFAGEVRTDGAWICQTSWGEAFGDGGFFYVSYEDARIGEKGTVFTRSDPPDHYDNIYQSDLCGRIGRAGFASDTVWMANCYTAENSEALCAAGFYTVGEGNSYEIWYVPQAEGKDSFPNRKRLAAGQFPESGFVTVEFPDPPSLEAGEDFALLIRLTSPGETHPAAVEYRAGRAAGRVILEDGKGYLSPDGENWESAEESYDCNICLKAYTRKLRLQPEKEKG